jgi:hypothetical protein
MYWCIGMDDSGLMTSCGVAVLLYLAQRNVMPGIVYARAHAHMFW